MATSEPKTVEIDVKTLHRLTVIHEAMISSGKHVGYPADTAALENAREALGDNYPYLQ